MVKNLQKFNAKEESKGSMDDFAIIDESKEGFQRDQKLLGEQMRGLINSTPISIEEKGYII
jgi:hypothetical protein